MTTAAVVVAATGLVACGGDDEESTAGSTGQDSAATKTTERLNIALYPSTDYAPLYVGMKDGTFEKHGLQLDVKQVLTGTGIISAVTSGSADLGTNSATAGATGIINGLPIKMVVAADLVPTEGYVEVLVRKDSGIDGFADLAGKKVATINLEGSFELAVRNAVQSDGGDWKSLKALAMAPTDEANALKAGRVDAIVLQDPFVARAKEDPALKSLGNPFAKFDYKMVSGGFYAANKTIEKKADALQRFRDALTEVSKKVQADPALARQVIPEYTELEADVAEKIQLPVFDTAIPPDSMTTMLEQMKDYGWIKKVPPVDQVVWSGT